MLPILPENVDDIDEYNDYMIALAEYEKVNEVLCGYIVSRCTKRLSDKVKDLLTVKAVLIVLKSDCTPSGAFITILKHREIQALTLDSVADYLTFVLEFNRLIEEYNRLLHAAQYNEAHKILLFTSALGPTFADWIDIVTQTCSIAGAGTGSDLTFSELEGRARAKYFSM
ncbi:unnamed protein product [Zymoseptoria tritici ST99CH_3D7]|uniref:Uncharacterized protein n=1 Tax=Zymoseptoria tritici (strain ST99CH_3D7) TaxID=1276538 RepID=A0A1X7RZX8_ZYMT9|nr:unnamed protein product [Zymoseptoria tritici ST99CH_3D7]